jgi:hypothetical protein
MVFLFNPGIPSKWVGYESDSLPSGVGHAAACPYVLPKDENKPFGFLRAIRALRGEQWMVFLFNPGIPSKWVGYGSDSLPSSAGHAAACPYVLPKGTNKPYLFLRAIRGEQWMVFLFNPGIPSKWIGYESGSLPSSVGHAAACPYVLPLSALQKGREINLLVSFALFVPFVVSNGWCFGLILEFPQNGLVMYQVICPPALGMRPHAPTYYQRTEINHIFSFALLVPFVVSNGWCFCLIPEFPQNGLVMNQLVCHPALGMRPHAPTYYPKGTNKPYLFLRAIRALRGRYVFTGF